MIRRSRSPFGRRTLARLAPLAVALNAVIGCSEGSGANPAQAGGARPKVEFPVEVQAVAAHPVEYAVRAVGSVEAFETVAVTARVAGVIERVRFAEGDTVTDGQPLVEVEPERYRLAVASARAALVRAEAEQREAELGLERRESVNAKRPDLVKAEDVDAFRTQVAVASADVAEERSALQLAELNLRDAFVRAPVSGIIQTRSAQTGQYVQPGAVLATLVRREPLLLRFQVPEQEAAPLAPGHRATFTVTGNDRAYTAELSHVAAQASQTTRMVEVTARVDDAQRGELRPGAFAEVTVPVGSAGNSPVIPQTAVRPSERGFLAFVVEEGVARERVLELGLRTADGQVEVRSGVRPGETLVVRGAEALRDGAAVKVQEAGSATPSAATPAETPAEAKRP
jgi:multidrug efflux system membrane fusion protein